MRSKKRTTAKGKFQDLIATLENTILELNKAGFPANVCVHYVPETFVPSNYFKESIKPAKGPRFVTYKNVTPFSRSVTLFEKPHEND